MFTLIVFGNAHHLTARYPIPTFQTSNLQSQPNNFIFGLSLKYITRHHRHVLFYCSVTRARQWHSTLASFHPSCRPPWYNPPQKILKYPPQQLKHRHYHSYRITNDGSSAMKVINHRASIGGAPYLHCEHFYCCIYTPSSILAKGPEGEEIRDYQNAQACATHFNNIFVASPNPSGKAINREFATFFNVIQRPSVLWGRLRSHYERQIFRHEGQQPRVFYITAVLFTL